jgi:O-antigen/teichoic acid export membrane protein
MNVLSRILNIDVVQRQSIISLFWQLAITAVGFGSTMYFAHAVGAELLGAYFLLMAYFGFFNLVSDGGIGGAGIKRISEGEEEDEYFSAFFTLRSIFLITVLMFLIWFGGSFVDLKTSGLFIWLLLLMVISLFQGSVAIGVVGRGKMGIASTCNAITIISSIIFQIIAIYLGYGAAGLAGGMVAGLFLGGIIELRFFDLHLVRFNWQHIKSLFVFAFWLFLSSGGALVFLQADTILIGYFMENSDVGIYRVVLQFTMAATFTTYALRTTLWPKVSLWGKSGEVHLVEKSLARAFSYSLILAIPVLTGGILLGDKLLYFFYGADFSSGYKALVILLAVQVVNVFQFFFTMYLDALNYPKESFKVTAIAASANIILDILLIPSFGILGAAVATLLSMILNATLARHALSKIITIRVEPTSLLNIVKASSAMALFLGVYRWLVPLSSVWMTLLPVAVGGAIFCILILKMDKKIYDDLKIIVMQMNLPWPYWM